MDKEYARGWLRAIFDGEGSVSWSNKAVSMANTEPSVIEDAIRCLAVFGIAPRRYEQHRPPNKPITRLVVSKRADVTTFANEVGSSIPYKRATLDRLLDYYNRPNQKRRNQHWGPPIPSREDMEPLFAAGLRHAEVAERLGVPIGTLGAYKRMHGLSPPNRKGPQPDPEEVRRAYWDEKLSLVELSARYGYKGNGVRQFMRRHGIPLRPPGIRTGK